MSAGVGAILLSLAELLIIGVVIRRLARRGSSSAPEIDPSTVPACPEPVSGLTGVELDLYSKEWARLLCDGADWIARRKETVTLLDVKTLRRKQSLDFSVPSALPVVGEGDQQRVYVPLVFLEKAPATFTRFDFADEAHSSLALPTKYENGVLSAYILHAAARRVTGQGLSVGVRRLLTGIALSDFDRADVFFDKVIGSGADTDEKRQLRDDEAFNWLAGCLASSSVVVVPVDVSHPAERHIVKLSFNQSVEDIRARRGIGDLGLWLGWRAFEVTTDSPFVGAASYHFEAEVTPRVEILDVYTITEFPDEFVEVRRSVAMSPRAHVYLADAAGGRTSVSIVKFRVERDSFLLGAVVAAAFGSIVQALCVIFSEHIVTNSASFASLIVALPSLIIGYTLRGTGHDLATRLVPRARAVLLVAAVVPYVAGGRLAAGLAGRDPAAKSDEILRWWEPCLFVSVACTLVLALSYRLPLPARRSANDSLSLAAVEDDGEFK